jgi:hypothetical protein
MTLPYIQPAASLGLSRRRWPRLDVRGRLRAQIDLLDLTMAVRDISRGGFAAESPVRFAHGEAHELTLHCDTGETAVVRARAVYCHARRDRANAFFVGWEALGDPATTQAMTRLVDLIAAGGETSSPQPPTPASHVAVRR